MEETNRSPVERVILVHVNFPVGKMDEDLDEFKELAVSAGAEIVAIITGTQRVPGSKYFVGSGKAEEIQEAVLAHNANLVIFNHVLSPAQERNLERLIKCRVLDRTGLILDIFAQRARSFEGKLQVELARLKHLSTRLVRIWTHLERQRGGIGLRGGPGETQLESDKRIIRNKIKMIGMRLDRLRAQRELGRRARRKAIIPTIALVGYTNAGKSTLFNTLTGAKVYVANQLFATLDPTLRRVDIPGIGPAILADTVGFIRHLSHDLVEAFHATLEEVCLADLLLHVVDANDPKKDLRIEQVVNVLEEIGAADVPRLIVYNKIDLRPDELSPGISTDDLGKPKSVRMSAVSHAGLEDLTTAIGEILASDMIIQEIVLPPKEAKARADLYRRGAVQAEHTDEDGNACLTVRLSRLELEKFLKLQ
ncbi:MAG: ribosome rescue GTPase HflX [Gammaproteobacteria bacterium]